MTFRPYDPDRDKHACHRIYREVGWIDASISEDDFDWYLRNGGEALVAELDGEAECLVTHNSGDVCYQRERLPFGCITGVTTSRVARRQRLAMRLTAQAIADEVQAGAIVAGLGMFDQGYYNRLGFGSGAYEHYFALPTQDLKVDVTPRVPKRLSVDDWEAIHAARLKRRRGHGSVSLIPGAFTRGRMTAWGSNFFGLGYADEPDGSLSHLIWCSAPMGHGPYDVKYLIYRTREQFLELVALLKSLGDQVYTVKLAEPAEVQLQDLVRQPLRNREVTSGSPYQTGATSACWWQMRLCDLPACLERTHLPEEPVRFNLTLTDPIEHYLAEDMPWRGVAGEYVVTLGPDSRAHRGRDGTLPTINATVNAFTRLWLGIRPATGLAMTDEVEAPPELLERLDDVVRLPRARPDWDF